MRVKMVPQAEGARASKKLRRELTWTMVLLLCCFWVNVQAAEVSDNLVQVYKSGSTRFYTFNYPSKSASGEDIVLSSQLIAWMPSSPASTDSIESLHIYSHYTITADKECPTLNQDFQMRLLFSSLANGKYGSDSDCNYVSRCVVIAPDYEGYGASKDRSHPYLSEELTARQVLDAVQYGLELYRKLVGNNQALEFKSDWRSFSWGFSQGGAVALAVHRYIEENGLSDELRFRGSICGDGPYDLIATMRYYMEDDGTSYDLTTAHQAGTCTMPMVMPMIVKGALDSHPVMQGHSLDEYFSRQFLDTGIMDWLASKQYSTGDIEKKWYQQLQNGLDANGRHYTPAQMAELFYSPSGGTVWGKLDKIFTAGYKDYSADHWADLYQAMVDNSVATGWQPQHRIQFVHSRGDTVVPYGNYLAFRDAHPEDEGELYRIDDSVSPLDHGNVGMQFFISLAGGTYGKVFQWLDEIPNPTGIENVLPFGQAQAEQCSMFNVQSNGWYTLDGRILNERPTVKGLYIHNGKKVAIK